MSKVRKDSEEDIEEEEEVEVEDVDVDVDEVEEDDSKKDDDDDDADDDAIDEVSLVKKRVSCQDQESTIIKIIDPNNRITTEYMTSYEYTSVVGVRATHISEGAPLYTDPSGLHDPIDIAKKEIAENKCPLSITRKIGNSMIEIWEVNEMVKPNI